MAQAKKAKVITEPENGSLTVDRLREKILAGDYTTTQSVGATKEERDKYATRTKTLERYLKRDLLIATGLSTHRKARAALQLATEIGTVSGTAFPTEVLKALSRIASLMDTLPE